MPQKVASVQSSSRKAAPSFSASESTHFPTDVLVGNLFDNTTWPRNECFTLVHCVLSHSRRLLLRCLVSATPSCLFGTVVEDKQGATIYVIID